jgi:hypothetical protein
LSTTTIDEVLSSWEEVIWVYGIVRASRRPESTIAMSYHDDHPELKLGSAKVAFFRNSARDPQRGWPVAFACSLFA